MPCNIRHKWKKALVTLLLTLISLVPIVAQDVSEDMLVYTIPGHNGTKLTYSSYVYNPSTDVSKPISIPSDTGWLVASSNGHLAFAAKDGDKSEIYVLDNLLSDPSPINISQSSFANDLPLSWSLDGRYLAFASSSDPENTLMYVWDGNAIINITPNHSEDSIKSYYDATWSLDDRLSFTAVHTFRIPDDSDPSEIYLWDGHTTANLSQNPTGADIGPAWSVGGRLAFLSAHTDGYDIFVWDGVSVKNGSPNKDKFINVAPELTTHLSHPSWASNGVLEFVTSGQDGIQAQIYEWDGQATNRSSRNSSQYNGILDWSPDGRWAVVTEARFDTVQQRTQVIDKNDQTVFSIEGQVSYSKWSSSNYLTICTLTSSGWVLSIWDGKHVDQVVEGSETRAQWLSGTTMHCTNG